MKVKPDRPSLSELWTCVRTLAHRIPKMDDKASAAYSMLMEHMRPERSKPLNVWDEQPTGLLLAIIADRADASPLTRLKMAREAFLHYPRWSVRLAAAVCPKIDDAIAALEDQVNAIAIGNDESDGVVEVCAKGIQSNRERIEKLEEVTMSAVFEATNPDTSPPALTPDASPLTLLKMARDAFVRVVCEARTPGPWDAEDAKVASKINDAISALEGEADDS